MAQRIKKGDTVVIISGNERAKKNQPPKTGKVLRFSDDGQKVFVEGVNRVWKHVKPSQRFPQGGRIQKEAAIHVSNVQPLDPTTGKGTRVKFETRDGVKHRVARKSGTSLGTLTAPKE